MNFNIFSLHPVVGEGARQAGYVTPTPIQAQAIPEVMQGRDVMGLAQTGTGKTAAFVLPILHRLIDRHHGGTNGRTCHRKSGEKHGSAPGRIGALIIAPTRELAEQIHVAIESLGCRTRLRSAAIYGGVGINPQIQALKRADIVVACPGRLLDQIDRGNVDFSGLEVLVLDEADQMFDMGFFPDVRRIVAHLPDAGRQTLLFSATMPEEIRHLADEVLQDPVTVQIGSAAPADSVSHALFPVAPHLKTALLIKLLGHHAPTGSVLVFTRTKFRAKSLDQKLARAGYRSTSLQGNLSQGRRRAALDGFRCGEFQIMVATDIAARGIDISNVSHVINYDIPATPEAYIHRIGRTGRAERSGEAFTLVTHEDTSMVRAINAAVGSRVEQRRLQDFNYDAPPASGGNKDRTPARRAQPGGERKMTKARKRGDKGAFGWLTSDPPRRAGRRGKPSEMNR